MMRTTAAAGGVCVVVAGVVGANMVRQLPSEPLRLATPGVANELLPHAAFLLGIAAMLLLLFWARQFASKEVSPDGDD